MITALYASALSIMFLVLSYRVIFLRYKLNISVGDGDNKEMQKLIHARNNIVDYVPFALLMMFILESMEMTSVILHILGGGIIISRLLQGWGLSMSSGSSIGRISGAIIMHIVFAAEAFLCMWNFIFLSLS